jgi:hypothetical protein
MPSRKAACHYYDRRMAIVRGQGRASLGLLASQTLQEGHDKANHVPATQTAQRAAWPS